MHEVAIFRHQLFLPSEPFIRQQAERLSEFRPVYVGRTRHGEPPVGAKVYALEDLPAYRSFPRRVWQVVTGDARPYERLLATQEVSVVHAHFGVEGLYACPWRGLWVSLS